MNMHVARTNTHGLNCGWAFAVQQQSIYVRGAVLFSGSGWHVCLCNCCFCVYSLWSHLLFCTDNKRVCQLVNDTLSS